MTGHIVDRGTYGFHDDLRYAHISKKGLDEDVVRALSELKKEPKWMLDIRLEALRLFESKSMPSWGPDLGEIDFSNIHYYASPISDEEKATAWEKVPEKIKKTFEIGRAHV